RRRKSGSNSTLWIVLAAVGGVGALAICGGIVLALVLPAVQQAREAARRVQAQAGGMPAAPASPGGLFGGSAPTGPAWTPNPAYAGQLPTKVAFDRYTLQLPPGFTPQPIPAEVPPAGIRLQSHVWGGPPSLNGTAMIGVDILDASQGIVRPHELDFILSKFLQTVQTATPLNAFRRDPAERGQLAGKASVRSRFSGTIMAIPVRGIAYITIDGNQRILRTFAICPTGHSNPTFEQLEAAILTLQ
ncbi:MAG TPA: hypothetical protein VHB99_09365, partial [Pirellulales bacterium]|nr:hypothetical protein [Pirellulales bacterium]